MSVLDPTALAAIQPELTSGESVLWTGQPETSVIFHKEDVFLIPFSLLWGGFAIFWEAGVSGLGPFSNSHQWIFGMLWGIPFVLVGQYFIWGRFFVAAWKKKRTYYAVTNKRVIVVQNAWRRQTTSAFVDAVPSITREDGRNGVGSLTFGITQPAWSRRNNWGAWDGMSLTGVPVFRDIEDIDSIYRLVSDLRESARAKAGS